MKQKRDKNTGKFIKFRPDHYCVDCGKKLSRHSSFGCRCISCANRVSQIIRIKEGRSSSKFIKGHKINVGRIVSIETKIKIGLAHRGKPLLKNRGVRHPNWKGGISKLTDRIRKSFRNRNWKLDIFRRDNWTCQTCYKRGGYVVAHHRKKFSEIIKEKNICALDKAINCSELWDLENGITLCDKCHKLIHRRKI